MDALIKQEELLKSKLEDASSIAERREIRGSLRELRRKIQDVDLNKDENANTVAPKADKNANTILLKQDINGNSSEIASKDAHVHAKNSLNESKTSNDTKASESKNTGPEYRVTDGTPDLKVKSADERASRRAKRQDRMNRLAKEQTEDEKKESSNAFSKKAEIKDPEKDKSSSYRNDGFKSTSKQESVSKVEDEPKESIKRPPSQRFDRFAPKTEPVAVKKVEETKTSIAKPFTPRFEKKEESVKVTPVDTPDSLVSKTERKVERTSLQQTGSKFAGVKHTVEEKSVIENKQQTTYGTRTNSRFSNSMDKFGSSVGQKSLNGTQVDKTKAASAIGKALSIGSIRDKFASAEKTAPSKPADLGMNFAKKNDRPGYTVKKFSETKIEEKTKTSKPALGMNYMANKGQNEAGAKSNLRETSVGSNYKKATPEPRPRHQTAPAAPESQSSFSMPGGGPAASSVVDRMKFFRQAQEEEKAQAEKQKTKEQPKSKSESSVSNSISNSSTENRTAPCLKKRDVKKPVRRTMSISSIVLDWCKEMVKDYGVTINNFSGSWGSGLAFCALIHKFNPNSFDYNELNATDRRRNFEVAFDTAFEVKKIPKLLDVEDMVQMPKPEPRSVQCYVQWIWSVYGPTSGYGPSQEEIKESARS